MEFIQSLQGAINYMEEHILEQITYEDVARHMYMSSYHFHRTFRMVTGMTANEYIRNRKLSMAGQELSMSEVKVIDIAFKYGYDSPESFTKAFSRFHGVAPNVARRTGMTLTSFPRLVIKIIVEGGTAMEYRIETRSPFTLLAKVEQFRNECIAEDGNTEIPEFWKSSGESGVFEALKANTKNHKVYGVCAPISNESTHFDYGIGMEYDGGSVPEGFKLWQVKPTLWVAFPCIGTTGECIGTTWEKIYKEFLPSSEYNMLDDTDFELYQEFERSECFCEIWIPVEKKTGV